MNIDLNVKEQRLIKKLLEDRYVGPAEVAQLVTDHWVVQVAKDEVALIEGLLGKLDGVRAEWRRADEAEINPKV